MKFWTSLCLGILKEIKKFYAVTLLKTLWEAEFHRVLIIERKRFLYFTLTQYCTHNRELISLSKDCKAAKHLIKNFCGTSQDVGYFIV